MILGQLRIGERQMTSAALTDPLRPQDFLGVMHPLINGICFGPRGV